MNHVIKLAHYVGCQQVTLKTCQKVLQCKQTCLQSGCYSNDRCTELTKLGKEWKDYMINPMLDLC